MAKSWSISTDDSFVRYIVDKITPQVMLAYQATAAEQELVDELAEKNKAGTLTPKETEMLQWALTIDVLVAALKARALEVLDLS